MRRSLVLLVAAGLAACTTERTQSPPTQPTVSAAPPVVQQAPPQREVSDDPSFVDGRDPFQGPTISPPIRVEPPQVKIKGRRFAVDQLRLVGIVTRDDVPRAMLVDPNGKGWVVSRGDYVGRPDTVRDRDTDRSLFWRVARVREGDVVIARIDPARPDEPPTTRVIALRTAEPEPVATEDD